LFFCSSLSFSLFILLLTDPVCEYTRKYATVNCRLQHPAVILLEGLACGYLPSTVIYSWADLRKL
jgi:hypothetical protein